MKKVFVSILLVVGVLGLVEPVFTECWRMPNKEGYTVFRDIDGIFYVTARTGDD